MYCTLFTLCPIVICPFIFSTDSVQLLHMFEGDKQLKSYYFSCSRKFAAVNLWEYSNMWLWLF